MATQSSYARLLYSLAVILRNNSSEVLLTFRGSQVAMGNIYGLPGGHIEQHESMRQAIVREVDEELGVVIEPENTELIHVMHFKGSSTTIDEECTAFFFKIDKWSGTLCNKEPHKHECLRWFSINNLPENLLPRHKKGLLLGLQAITYSEDNWSV